jgi:hypothetical protein
LGLVAVIGLAYLLLEIAILLLAHVFGNSGVRVQDLSDIRYARAFILGSAAGCYAIFRLKRFHPALNLGYSTWLKTSPWTSGKPLPLGPVHPVWQDAVVLGVLAGFSWWLGLDPTVPVAVFGLTYLLGMTILLAGTHVWRPVLILGFLWPLLVLPRFNGPYGFIILAAITSVIWYGHCRSLQSFPWKRLGFLALDSENPARAKSLLEAEISIDLTRYVSRQNQSLGWPFQWLAPSMPQKPISLATSAAVSSLAGWWTYCTLVSSETSASSFAVLLLAGFASFVRVAIYCAGVVPSFSIWGRFAHGRLIVPGFDRVFVTPVAAILLALVGGVWIEHAGESHPSVTAIVVGLICLTLLSGGPSLGGWALTGHYRYRSPSRLFADKRFSRPV